MRPQITSYLHPDTKKWLTAYAKKFGMDRSEVVRVLLEREKQVRWLQWALATADPAMSDATKMKRRRDRLPPHWNKRPKPTRP